MPRIGVVFSRRDPAGSGAAKILSELLSRGESSSDVLLAGFEEDVVDFEFLRGADEFIILSKHRSEAEIPCLTVHHPGNPTPRAQLGGKPCSLAWSSPVLSYEILREMVKEARGSIEVTYEVTHHGPTEVPKPVVFAEIGSTPREWSSEELQRALARAIETTISRLREGSGSRCRRAIGIGGGHYARAFTRMALEEGYCFGHILAKHAVREGLCPDALEQAIDKNLGGVEEIVLEKKAGPSEFRRSVAELASRRGLELTVI
ncbi:MAG: D-aminoacyl-tRNA deacylase [Fervidicoccaceae archaeon]